MRAFRSVRRRAEGKLDYLTDLWARYLGPGCEVENDGPLKRALVLPERFGIERLGLAYGERNKLFAVLYDLRYELVVSCGLSLEGASADADGGRLLRMDAAKRSFHAAPAFEGAARDLSCDLVFDRVEQLGISELSVSAGGLSGTCRIEAQGFVGSATWNLLPPVFDMIAPRPEDCARGIELFRMIAAVVG